MATSKFSQLPTVVSSTLNDIIAADQAGQTTQQTLNQVYQLIQSNVVLNYAGNPNTHVAGTVYQLCWDTVNSLLYICTTSGTAVTAVWTAAGAHASIVPLNEGGTNANLTASNGGIVWCNATQMQILSGVAAAGKMLQSGNLATPSWSTPTWPSASGTSGNIIISDGTNNIYSTPTWPNAGGSAGSVVISDGTNKINSTSLWVNSVGSAGTLLRSNGTSNIYSTSTFADTYAISTLLYASGANTITGLATANSAMLYTNSTGVPAWSASMTNGQVMIGSTGASPAPATLTAGTGISIINAANSITISTSASGLSWSNIGGTTQTAAVGHGYISDNAAQTTITLPTTFSVGDVVLVEGLGAAGWILKAGVATTIQIGGGVTSAGGTLTSAASTDNIEVVGIVANTTWRVQRTNSAGLTIA